MGASRTRVLVLGHGEMGHAMEALLGPIHQVSVWQRHPGSRPVPQLESAAIESDFIIFCLPAMAHDPVSQRLRGHLSPQATCLTIAKGIDDRGRTPSEILSGSIDPASVAVLYGPMISEEIRAGRPAFAQTCATDPARTERVAQLFRGTALHVESSSDRTGLSWSAILKNVYAMAFGLADELALGDNVRGYLAVIALHELDAIVRLLGGAATTPFHLAGLGDLITTATSAGSHHHDLGRRMARGEANLSGEGLHTLSVLDRHARFDEAAFPLFGLLKACARESSGAATAFREFVSSGKGIIH